MIHLATVFSGIGAVEHALTRLGIEKDIVFACDNGERKLKTKVFIYENVTGMLNHDGGQTWKVISDIFDDLGYCWKYWVLNAKDYGLPQNRRRIFVVGFQKQYESLFLKLSEPPKQKLNSVLSDYLEQDI